MKDIISVIIPVYNVESYLRQCLDSVLSQSYSSLQVILIDDGSTDNSGVICDEYAKKDTRIFVIHQKNNGAAAAKNAGLRVAIGKYLGFVDSDDYLESDAYEYMVEQLNASNADVIHCSFRNVYINKSVPHEMYTGQTEFSSAQFLEQFTRDWTCGLLWDKLYLRSVFDGVWFEEGHKIDDEYFTYRGIINAKKIIRDNRIVYNYRQRRSGVMKSSESARQIVLDRVDYIVKRRRKIISIYPQLRRVFDTHFLDMMVILSRDPNGSEKSIRMIREQLILYCKEPNHTHADIRLWPALAKIYFCLVKPVQTEPDSKSMDVTQYFI